MSPEIENKKLNSAIHEPCMAGVDGSNELASKPLSLFESLEHWRAFSTIADRRLQQVFDATPLSDQPQAVIPELFARLHAAFALAGPFYNIEALVADGRDEKSDNPIDFTAEGSTAGRLDTVAMLLPAVLKDRLTARQLDWGGSTWAAIDATVNDLRESFLHEPDTIASQQFKLINKVGAMAGIDPQTVLFAANALEFIPLEVGGKSGDLPQHEALAVLTQLLEQPDNTP